MKLIVVSYPDNTDISSATIGATVAIGSIAGGRIMSVASIVEETPVLLAHTHSISAATIGAAIPTR